MMVTSVVVENVLGSLGKPSRCYDVMHSCELILFRIWVLGALLWSAHLISRIWTTWRTKETNAISPTSMALSAISGVFLGVYNIQRSLGIPVSGFPPNAH